MKLKAIIPYIIVGVLGILLLNLIAFNNQLTTPTGIDRLEVNAAEHLVGTLWCFLFGLLVEWKTIVRFVKRETRFQFSPLIIIGFIILAISCLPQIAVVIWCGIPGPFPAGTRLSNFFIGPLAHSSIIQSILAVTAGCIIVRGMAKSKASEKQQG